jgi:hypothetical protein
MRARWWRRKQQLQEVEELLQALTLIFAALAWKLHERFGYFF